MPGFWFVVSVLADFGQESIELWSPSVRLRVDRLRTMIRRRIGIESDSVLRLFFNGQELQNQYAIGDYDIGDRSVIQATVVHQPEPLPVPMAETQSPEPVASPAVVENFDLPADIYYQVGDHIDAYDPDTGAWFPATVSGIAENHQYRISFRKTSMATRIGPLEHVRPPPYRRIERADQLQPGQMVMALMPDLRLWYVAGIESIRPSRQRRSTKIGLTVVAHGTEMPLVSQVIRFRRGAILHLESNVHRQDRTAELERVIRTGNTGIDRRIEPDCRECGDDIERLECIECGCQVCQKKCHPDRQLVCDECDRATHLWCLRTPIDTVPVSNEPWYCDRCRTETREEIQEKQHRHLDQIRTSGSWGNGMACVGRSGDTQVSKAATFGSIPDVPVGTWWRFRVQSSEAGVHAPLVAGIHGRENIGAYSVVYAAANANDVDRGMEIYYTGNGGGRQKKIQELKREILALARNCPVPVIPGRGGDAGDRWRDGKPIRLLRSGNGRRTGNFKSPYLPKIGIRYDGLYKVVKYWPETGSNGRQIWRFLLRRDDPEPAPWTEPGRYRARKLGLIQICYPDGWCQELGQKRTKKIDDDLFRKQSKRSQTKSCPVMTDDEEPAFHVDDQIWQLIRLDKSNEKIWLELLSDTKITKNRLQNLIRETFRCACCMEMLQEPVTGNCGHNFCSECLRKLFQLSSSSGNSSKSRNIASCPVCRSNESFVNGQFRWIENSGSEPVAIFKCNTILDKLIQIIMEK